MIKEVSALKTVPAKVGKIVKKTSKKAAIAAQDCNDFIKEKMSYVRFAERNDSFDTFTTEHFDYLRYLGIRD